MNLYLVCHVDTDSDGTNMDLFVRCTTPEEAVDHWRGHFHDFFPDQDDDGETIIDEPLPDHVFVVPQDGLGVLQWHQDVVSVVTRYHAVKAAKEALGVEP